MQAFTVPEWTIAQGNFVPVLASMLNAEVVTFGPSKRLPAWYKRVVASFEVSRHISTWPSTEQAERARQSVDRLASSLRSNDDVFNFEIDGLRIGEDIYETYLRAGNPTVDLADTAFWDVLTQAMNLLIFWREYLDKNDVRAVIVSHDCYIDLNILARLAYQRGISVYLPNARGLQQSRESHHIYATRFWRYPEMIVKLTRDERQQGIEIARNALSRRLSGEVAVDMPYSTKSAFQQTETLHLAKIDPRTTGVVIATHCFFDNPHAYGGMMFKDFWEWLNFVGTISLRTDYQWFIKVHPDYRPGTMRIIKEFVKRYPHIVLVPASTSFHELKSRGVDVALTCYGSIAHELPLLGYRVVNCAYNPHVAYDFSMTAVTKDDYAEALLSLPDIKISINEEHLYEFYYAHYYYTYVDDLVYLSHRQMLSELSPRDQRRTVAFQYYSRNTPHEHALLSRQRMREFLLSDKDNFFVNGPE